MGFLRHRARKVRIGFQDLETAVLIAPMTEMSDDKYLAFEQPAHGCLDGLNAVVSYRPISAIL